MKEYKIKIGKNGYDVCVNRVGDGIAEVTVNGESYSVEVAEVQKEPETTVALTGDGATAGNATAGAALNAGTATASAGIGAAAGAGRKICSPLPGVIIEISVNVGQTVKRGQKVAVLEAMKMENEIQSEYDGTVTAINAAKGDSLLEGAEIVTIA